MAQLVIFGTGDVARIAKYYFETDSSHEVVAFTVDAGFRAGETFEGLPLVAFEEVYHVYPPAGFKMFIAVSYAQMNRLRASKYDAARAMGYELVSYVSSRCSFLSGEPPGDNCMIQEDNTIQPFARIGNNVTLWSGNHIGHDSVIEDHCFISSHVVVSGRVRVGSYSFVGVNATLGNAITIAPRTLVGAGALIVKDTIEDGVYVPPRSVLLSKKSYDIEL